MARQLSTTHTRLVFKGPTTNPTECACEYAVADGELFEESKRHHFDPLPALTAQSSAYWTARMEEVETAEGIT